MSLGSEEVFNEPEEEFNESSKSFHIFKANWKADNILPDGWYTERTSNKSDFLAFFWAPALEAYSGYTGRCTANASNLKELVSTLNNHNLKTYDFIPLVSTGPFTRRAAIEQLDQLSGLKNGDCCLIFYSGVGIVNERSKQQVEDGFIAEPLFSEDELSDPVTRSLRDELREVTIDKGIHVFIILDFHLLVTGEMLIPPFANSSGTSLVVLESAVPVAKDLANSPSFFEDNFFYEELAEIIQSTGAKTRYSNLASL